MITLKHPLTASERSQLADCLSARGPGTPAGIAAALGRFAYRNIQGGQIELIGTEWTRRNIVEIDVATELPGWPVNSLTGRPQGRLYVHRLMAVPLRLAWREIRARGLAGRLRTYDGCWVPRHQLHNPANPLSVHSWAAAIDLDARWNGYGVRPVIDEGVIRTFEEFGFSSGKRWRPFDGMHLEWVLPPASLPRMPWQDGALAAPAPAPKPITNPALPPKLDPAYIQPPSIFLRGIGEGNTVMDDKTAEYGGGTVTRMTDGRLRLEGFSGTVGTYFDHALQLDRLEEL